MNERPWGFALIAAAAMLLSGCEEARPSGSGEERAPSVAASFFPLAEAAAVIGEDRVVVTNVTPVGAEPHDVELSPAEVDAVLDADLLLYQGGGFQPSVERLVEQRDGLSVDVLEGLELMEARQDGHQDKGDEHGNGSSDHSEEGDPHVWLDPLRYARIVERIGTALAEVDPEGEERYRSNAETHADRVRDLHERFDRRLRDCGRDLLVVTHAAFGYLADRYDLRQEPIAGISPEGEPDPRRLSELVTLVREEGVTTVFTEPLLSQIGRAHV